MIETPANIIPSQIGYGRANQTGLIQVGIFASGVILGVVLSLLLIGSRPTSVVQEATQPNTPAKSAQATDLPASASIPPVDQAKTIEGARDFLRIGNANAPVKVVIFSDPRCPYCKAFAGGAEKELLNSDYVKNGQVALVYRHMPVLGAPSRLISKALECAGRQGQFKASHDAVYASASADTLDESGLTKWPVF